MLISTSASTSNNNGSNRHANNGIGSSAASAAASSAVANRHVTMAENEFIPPELFRETDMLGPHLGRAVLYEPRIVYTPVLASLRVFRRDQGHGQGNSNITKGGIDELNRKLAELLVVGTDGGDGDEVVVDDCAAARRGGGTGNERVDGTTSCSSSSPSPRRSPRIAALLGRNDGPN